MAMYHQPPDKDIAMEHDSITSTPAFSEPIVTDDRTDVPVDRPPTVALGPPLQLALLVGGAALIGILVALLLWNDLGPGPIDAFVVGIHSHTGLSISGAIWITFGLMNLVAWAMGRRPGIGTLLAPIVAGFVIEVVLSILDNFGPPDLIATRIALQIVAIGVAGIGVGAMVASRLGAGPPELLASALSDRTGVSESITRMGFEVSCLLAALLLGGPVGFGTILFAALIGPAVGRGCRIVDAALAAAFGRKTDGGRRTRPRTPEPEDFPGTDIAIVCAGCV
jgi:uncharacterized membrane protein YczE